VNDQSEVRSDADFIPVMKTEGKGEVLPIYNLVLNPLRASSSV